MTWLTVRFNLGVELLMVVRRTRLIALLAVFLLVLGAFPALADDNSFESVSPEEGVELVDAEAVERLAQWREENVGYRSEEVPGQLLVTTTQTATSEWATDAELDEEQVSSTGSRVHVVDVEPGSEAEVTGALTASADVEAVEPVHYGEFFEVPDDEYYDYQWAHELTSIEGAWDNTTG